MKINHKKQIKLIERVFLRSLVNLYTGFMHNEWWKGAVGKKIRECVKKDDALSLNIMLFIR